MKSVRFIFLVLFLILFSIGSADSENSSNSVAIPTPVEDSKIQEAGEYKYRLMTDGTVQLYEYNGTKKALILPDSLAGKKVSSIYQYSFSGDITEFLQSVTIPNSIIYMEANPFGFCKNLTSISVSGDHPSFSVKDNVLFSKDYKRLLCYPAGLTVQEYEVPDNVVEISKSAFYGSQLCSIHFPSSLTIIGDTAFTASKKLRDVIIPEGVTFVGDCAFSVCDNLSSVSFPSTLTEPTPSMFSYIKPLPKISFSSDTSKIEYKDGTLLRKTDNTLLWYLNNDIQDSYEIPDGVKAIGDYAFASSANPNNKLKVVNIPDSVTSVGKYAFNGSRIEKIVIPDSVTNLGEYAFTASSITDITLSNNMDSIGEAVFGNCYSLFNIVIPDGIERIENGAFRNCMNLKEIVIPASVVFIANDAFNSCESLQAYVVRDSYAEQYCKEHNIPYTYDSFNQPEDNNNIKIADTNYMNIIGDSAEVLFSNSDIRGLTTIALSMDVFSQMGAGKIQLLPSFLANPSYVGITSDHNEIIVVGYYQEQPLTTIVMMSYKSWAKQINYREIEVSTQDNNIEKLEIQNLKEFYEITNYEKNDTQYIAQTFQGLFN